MATFLIIWDLIMQVTGLYVLVFIYELDITGIALACSVTNFSSMCMLELYARFCCPELAEAFNGESTHVPEAIVVTDTTSSVDMSTEQSTEEILSKKTYHIMDRAGFYDYLQLGIPSVLSIISEWWAYNAMLLIAGQFGVDYLAAHVVLNTVIALEFQVSCGLSQGHSVVVG
jgi:Na+-driven multidrug efflux pump